MILNTSPQARAYRSYVPNLLHIYLVGEGPSERVCRRRSDRDGPSEKIRLSKKVRRRRFAREGSTKKVY